MKKQKGFTLIEVLVAMAIIGVIMVVGVNLLRVPTRANRATMKEFQVQSALRAGSQVVTSSVRDASSVFLLTKSTPVNAEHDLTKKWDYLVCEERDGVSMVVHYHWAKDAGGTFKHIPRVVAEAKDANVHFYIDFKMAENGKLLKYNIMARDVETGVEKEISSELKPLNAFSIIDNTKTDPFTGKKIGNALAFRNDALDPELGAQQTGYDIIMVSLVLDVSGSMSQKMSTGGGKRQRIAILRDESKKLVDRLFTSPNKDRIIVNLYPFSSYTFAGYSDTDKTEFRFRQLQRDIGKIKDNIDRLRDTYSTNVGDGIRWAYYDILKHEKDNQTKRIKNFLLVLTDGAPNTDTQKKGSDGKYHRYYDSSNNDLGYGDDWDGSYMRKMGSYVKAFPKKIDGSVNPDVSTQAEKIDVTVIGFSEYENDNRQCNGLGIAAGAEPGADGKYFITAGSDAALDAAFSQFSEKVLNKASLWYLVSPE